MGELGGVHLGGPSSSAAEAGGVGGWYQSTTLKRNSEPLALLFLSRKFKSCKTLWRASIALFTCPQRRRAALIQRNALIQIFQLES